MKIINLVETSLKLNINIIKNCISVPRCRGKLRHHMGYSEKVWDSLRHLK